MHKLLNSVAVKSSAKLRRDAEQGITDNFKLSDSKLSEVESSGARLLGFSGSPQESVEAYRQLKATAEANKRKKASVLTGGTAVGGRTTLGG